VKALLITQSSKYLPSIAI